MNEKDKEPTIYDLKLHQALQLNNQVEIARVPGGWVYTIRGRSVFVPFNDEFLEKEEEDPLKGQKPPF